MESVFTTRASAFAYPCKVRRALSLCWCVDVPLPVSARYCSTGLVSQCEKDVQTVRASSSVHSGLVLPYPSTATVHDSSFRFRSLCFISRLSLRSPCVTYKQQRGTLERAPGRVFLAGFRGDARLFPIIIRVTVYAIYSQTFFPFTCEISPFRTCCAQTC